MRELCQFPILDLEDDLKDRSLSGAFLNILNS